MRDRNRLVSTRLLTMLTAVLLCGGLARPAWSSGRVELTISVARDAPLTAQQTWVRELGQAGVRTVRLRGERTGDHVSIETLGSQDSTVYVVTGALNGRNELVLPGARFRPGDADRVARWLKDLAEQGPTESREATAAFGLPRSQLDAIRKELARPVDFSTEGQSRAEVIGKICDRLTLPVRMDSALPSAADQDKVDEQLRGMSCGTVLAYVLRPLGWGFTPRTAARGPELVIGKVRRDKETWPIGWPPEVAEPKLTPEMFALHTINVENVSVAEILRAVGARLKVRVLLDHGALARYGIDPAKILVTLPRRQTTYAQILSKALFQARLDSELCVDDSGKPFIWVTSLRPYP